MTQPTSEQRQLMFALFAFATLVFLLGIVVIGYLAGASWNRSETAAQSPGRRADEPHAQRVASSGW